MMQKREMIIYILAVMAIAWNYIEVNWEMFENTAFAKPAGAGALLAICFLVIAYRIGLIIIVPEARDAFIAMLGITYFVVPRLVRCFFGRFTVEWNSFWVLFMAVFYMLGPLAISIAVIIAFFKRQNKVDIL